MSVPVFSSPASQLVRLGLRLAHSLHYQLPPQQLIKHALSRQEGVLNDTGAQGQLALGRNTRKRALFQGHMAATNQNTAAKPAESHNPLRQVSARPMNIKRVSGMATR